jgi:hypothetical protein
MVALVVAALIAGTAPPVAADTTTTSTTAPGPTTTTPETTTAPSTSTTEPSTSTTAPSTSTTAPTPITANPTIDTPPLVGVDTMARVNGLDGVMLHTYNDRPLPGCPDIIPSSLGDSCFYADPGNGTSWVQIVVLNRQNLSLVSNTDIACDQATSKPQEVAFDYDGNPCNAALSNTIAGLNDNDLVIAVNQPGEKGNKTSQPPVGVGAVLGSVGNNHGIGTTPSWYNAPDHGAHLPNAVRGTVSAIGVPGWTSGGVSINSETPDQWGSGALVAELIVDNLATYTPILPSSVGDEKSSPVNKVLVQPPTSWPVATAKEQAALSALGTIVGLGPDPRAQYYSSPRTDAQWGQVQRTIDGTPTPTGVDPVNFAWAKTELNKEIGYVIDVNSYMRTVAAPYQGASTDLWSTFGQVVANVNAGTANGTSATITTAAFEVIKQALNVARAIGSVKTVMTVVASVYGAAMTMASNGGKKSDAAFAVQAGDLGREYQTRLNQTETMVMTRWRNAIVADYGKLQTVALCSTSAKGCADDNPGWDISVNDETHMESALKLGLERGLYSELVPDKYNVLMQLGNDDDNPSPERAKNLDNWCYGIPPFDNSTGAWVVRAYDKEAPDAPRVRVYILTNESGIGKWEALSRSSFDRMFGPVDPGGDYNKGGLGIDEASFFRDNYLTKGKFFLASHYLKWFGCFLSRTGSWAR